MGSNAIDHFCEAKPDSLLHRFPYSKTQVDKLRITIMATESWNNITEGETNLSGKFSINSNGLKWQSNDSEEKPVELPSSGLAGHKSHG